MKLRTAIKIQRVYEEPIKQNGRLRHRGKNWPYNCRQYTESAIICKRHWRDHRVPYIPSEDEQAERAEIQVCLLADVLIEDETERETFKANALRELARV